jgi:UDP-N-acetyl-D-galactosamine dehydrogenase
LQYGLIVEVYDPLADKEIVKDEYGIPLIDEIHKKYDALILAVSHNEFNAIDLSEITNINTVIYDSKAVLSRELVDARL